MDPGIDDSKADGETKQQDDRASTGTARLVREDGALVATSETVIDDADVLALLDELRR